MQDLLESEGETKKQLQKEIFEARQKEEEARIQLRISEEEAKKKEEFLRKKYGQELKSE